MKIERVQDIFLPYVFNMGRGFLYGFGIAVVLCQS